MLFRQRCPRRAWKPESASRREELVSTRSLAYHEKKRQESERLPGHDMASTPRRMPSAAATSDKAAEPESLQGIFRVSSDSGAIVVLAS